LSSRHLLQRLRKRSTSGVHRRRDGADFHAERFGDRGVIKVEVEPEEEGITLTLRQLA
jgi:hypothetical protein